MAVLSLATSMIEHMSDGRGKHVFLSYVKEDKEAVDRLCEVLEAAQIPYWRDRKSLGPGDMWKAKIREAVRDGSLVFLACFSDESRAREKSYQNEELTLAVEEFRKMPPGRTWLIPIRFDEGPVPEWDLGAGRVLGDLNYSDLFGERYTRESVELVTTIHRLMGEKRLDAATAMAAVEQATAVNRPDLLRRMTKDMLLEPSRRIELDELISKEVQRVSEVLADKELVASPLSGGTEEVYVKIASRGHDLWKLTEPFCASLQVATRWGSRDDLDPWRTGIRAFAQGAAKQESGMSALLELRHVPAVVAVMTVGLTATTSGKWGNLRQLVLEQSVRSKYDGKLEPLLEATDPYAPFGTGEWTAHVLARSAREEIDFAEAMNHFAEKKVGKYHTPAAEWLHAILRPHFRDLLPDDATYDQEWDRAEVVLGVLAQDVVQTRRAAAEEGRYFGRSHWFGRSTWRSVHHHGSAVDDLAQELKIEGAAWAPLRAGLFGGDTSRAETAITNYAENFSRMSRGMW